MPKQFNLRLIEWISESQFLLEEVDSLFHSLKQNVISSIKRKNDRVVFSFKQLEQTEMLAAHTDYGYNMLIEMATRIGRPPIPGSDQERKHRHNKGYQAIKALDKLGVSLSPEETKQIKQGLHSKVAKIASDLGFLFEIQVFLILRDEYHLRDEYNNDFTESVKSYKSKITINAGRIANTIFAMMMIHAKDLAKQIVEKSKEILGCADMVWFVGSSSASSFRADPADIQVGCSEQMDKFGGKVGYSIKFVTETDITLLGTTLTQLNLLSSMGAKRIKEIANNTKSEKEWKITVTEEIYQEIKNKINPGKFVGFLNYLLTSGNRTLPAMRNYGSSELGGVGWSGNIEKDFTITTNPIKPLKAKPDAQVEIDYTKTYVRLTYKRNDGSRSGTKILIIPHNAAKESILIKVNNLTSGRA